VSWPDRDFLVRGVDWSWYQQNSNGSYIDVGQFVAQNPAVEVFILRACWPNGVQDAAYPYYYDELTARGKKVAAYLWPNPTRPEQPASWQFAIGDRVPKLIMLDFELTYYQTDAVLTANAEESFAHASALFDTHVIGYTASYWWETHIKTDLEKSHQFILAHYPYFLQGGVWKEMENFEVLEKQLPIDNNFTPRMGARFTHDNVIGWQFSSKGRLPSYNNNMDLDSLKRAWVSLVFEDIPVPPTPLPPATETITILKSTADDLREALS
jgi:GH25 family lysozyme M1 (1,4-beta-N-acetylmuramidase)